MIFFLLAALLVLATVAVVCRPLLRDLSSPSSAGRYNMAVYREQLDALSRGAEPGTLEPDELAGARLEIERRLVASARETEPREPGLRRGTPAVAFALAAALTLGSGAIYLAIGRPGQPDHPLARTAGPSDAAALAAGQDADGMHARMDQMVADLQRKLQANPNDGDGWGLLARSLIRLDRAPEAVQAYAQAIAHEPADDPQLDREYAQARVIAAGGAVDDTAETLFRRQLTATPSDPQARYYLALARAQHGDVPGALQDWRALEKDSPADAPWLPTLRQRIAEASGQPAPPAAAPTAPSDDRQPGPTAADVAAASRLSPADQAQMIQGMVDGLAGRLKQNPDDLEGQRKLARAYTVLGRSAEANAAWRQVRRLDPHDPDAQAALGGS